MGDTKWIFTDQLTEKKSTKWTSYFPPEHKNRKEEDINMDISPIQSTPSPIRNSSSYSSTLNGNIHIPTFFATENTPSSVPYHSKAALMSSTVGAISRCTNPQKEC